MKIERYFRKSLMITADVYGVICKMSPNIFGHVNKIKLSTETDNKKDVVTIDVNNRTIEFDATEILDTISNYKRYVRIQYGKVIEAAIRIYEEIFEGKPLYMNVKHINYQPGNVPKELNDLYRTIDLVMNKQGYIRDLGLYKKYEISRFDKNYSNELYGLYSSMDNKTYKLTNEAAERVHDIIYDKYTPIDRRKAINKKSSSLAYEYRRECEAITYLYAISDWSILQISENSGMGKSTIHRRILDYCNSNCNKLTMIAKYKRNSNRDRTFYLED